MILKKYLNLLSINKLVFINVALFVICLPSAQSFTFDRHRFFELAIIFLNLLLSLLSSSFRQSLILQFSCFSLISRLLLLLLLLLAIASIVFAPLSSYALLETCLYAGLFFLSLSIASLASQKTVFFQTTFLITAIASSFFYQITFFSGYLASFIENMPLQWPEPFSGFSNIRLFNQYHLWLFFLISLPILVYPNLDPRLRTGIKINATGWAILLFVSGSRGAIITIFLTLLISFFVFKQQARFIIKLNLRCLFLGFIGSLLLFKLLPLLLQSDVVAGWRSVQEITTDAPRLYLWKTALDYILTHPWLGIGAMHYAYYPNRIATHPHNSLLQWGAEMGLPSLIIVVTLVACGLIAWIKHFNQFDKNIVSSDIPERQLWIALFCTMSAGLIYSLVDGVIVMPVSQVLMATIAGWMFGVYFQSESATAINGTKNLLTMGLAGVILISLTYSVMPDLAARLVGLEDTSTRPHPEPQHPRFWQQGEIPN